jgi:hypothetical protein
MKPVSASSRSALLIDLLRMRSFGNHQRSFQTGGVPTVYSRYQIHIADILLYMLHGTRDEVSQPSEKIFVIIIFMHYLPLFIYLFLPWLNLNETLSSFFRTNGDQKGVVLRHLKSGHRVACCLAGTGKAKQCRSKGRCSLAFEKRTSLLCFRLVVWDGQNKQQTALLYVQEERRQLVDAFCIHRDERYVQSR